MQLFNVPFPPTPLVLLMILVAIPAACFDVKKRRIPNWLSVAGALAAFATHFALNGLGGLGNSLAAFATAFAIYFLMYLLHAMGAGDVKLMAAVGAVAGLAWWLLIFVLTFLCGAILAIGLAAYRKRLGSTLWNVAYLARELASFRRPWLARKELDVKNPETLRLPHALSIALGVVLSLVLMFGNR